MKDNRNFKPRGNDPRSEHEGQKWLKDNIPTILAFKNAPDLDTILGHIKSFVESKCKDLSASQLRNLYAKIKSKKTSQAIQLMRPRLAYAAARQNSSEVREVVEFFEHIASNVKTNDQAANFVAFFECIVAYHKFYHGQKSK